MGEEDEPAQKRHKRVRQSCNQCRIKRCKCDGSAPATCAPCLASALTCTWGTTKRRGPQPSKPMTARIKKLEHHLRQLWQLIPGSVTISDILLRKRHLQPVSLPALHLHISDFEQLCRSDPPSDTGGNRVPGSSIHEDLLDSIAILEQDDDDRLLTTSIPHIHSEANLRKSPAPSTLPGLSIAEGASDRNAGVPNLSEYSGVTMEPFQDAEWWPLNLPEAHHGTLRTASVDLPISLQQETASSSTAPYMSLAASTGTRQRSDFTNLESEASAQTTSQPLIFPPLHNVASLVAEDVISRQNCNARDDIAVSARAANSDASVHALYYTDNRCTWDDCTLADSDKSHLKYFGFSSGAYLNTTGQAVHSSQTREVQDASDQANLATASVPYAIRTLLVDIYLVYLHPVLPMLDRLEILRWSTSDYVIHPALACALLAVTAPYIPNGLPHKFNQRTMQKAAAAVLLEQMENPSLQYVQACVLLALCSWAQNQMSAARSWTAQATSAALDCGLHCRSSLPESLKTHKQAIPIASRTWSCIYVLDVLLSACTGRPPQVPDNKEVTDMSTEGNEQWEIWKPESSRNLLSTYDINESAQNPGGLPPRSATMCTAQTLTNFVDLVRLCEHARSLLSILAIHPRDRAEDGTLHTIRSQFGEQAMMSIASFVEDARMSLTQHCLERHGIHVYFCLLADRERLFDYRLSSRSRRVASTILSTRLTEFSFLRAPITSTLLLNEMLLQASVTTWPSRREPSVDDTVSSGIADVCLRQIATIFPNAGLRRQNGSSPMLDRAGIERPTFAQSTGTSLGYVIPHQSMQVALSEHQQTSQTSDAVIAFMNNPSADLQTPVRSESLHVDVEQMLGLPEWQENDVLAPLGYMLTPSTMSKYDYTDPSLAIMIEAYHKGALY